MAVVDILRDRERGMVRYNQARRQYGLKPYTKFEEITDNADVRHTPHTTHSLCAVPSWRLSKQNGQISGLRRD